MDLKNVKLPSNKKFGYFFFLVFFILSFYMFFNEKIIWTYIFSLLSLSFLIITFFKPHILFPLNVMWMRVGLFLGMIVNPIVMSIIFFGIFTPIAKLMRLKGRDELRLKFNHKQSHWITRTESFKTESFKHQF